MPGAYASVRWRVPTVRSGRPGPCRSTPKGLVYAMKTLLSSAALAALLLPATAFAQVAPDPVPAQATDDTSSIVVTGIRSTVTPVMTLFWSGA